MSEDVSEDDDKHWRWSIPPVPLWRREEMQILRDVEDPLATTLWRALRDVRAWLEAAPEERAGIVRTPNDTVRERLAYAAAQAPELAGALGQFARLLNAPAGVDPHMLSGACAVVAEWAEERALLETSVQFAEVAATVDDESPRLANLAARVCKRAALHYHAETWYDRGIGLARNAEDDEQYIKARLGFGELLTDLGDHKRGRAHLLKAARRAAEKGLRDVAGETQHHLLHSYLETCPLNKALDHAETALNQYPLHHRRVPLLAHDLAYVLVKHGRFADAFPLVRQAVDRITVQDQSLCWSTVAWAAAGATLRNEYEQAKQRGESLAALYPEYAPGTLRHLAEGAALLSDWDDAERLAAQALEVAQARSDSQIVVDATALLDRIATRTIIARSDEQEPNWRVASLVLAFTHRLRIWRQK